MNPEAIQLACTTCARSFQEAGGDAAGWSILLLLAIIVPVHGAPGICMVRIVRREHETLDHKYLDQ
jgi:hypothetical protein